MNLDRIRSRVQERGMSVLVGAVDAAGAPSCCRGLAVSADDALTSATVFVPLATSRDIVAGAAATKRIAVVVAHVIDHNAFQLKGRIRALRLATDAEAMTIRANLNAFADLLIHIGMAPRLARSITHEPAFAIDFDVDEVYDQTPGPNAGVCVR